MFKTILIIVLGLTSLFFMYQENKSENMVEQQQEQIEALENNVENHQILLRKQDEILLEKDSTIQIITAQNEGLILRLQEERNEKNEK